MVLRVPMIYFEEEWTSRFRTRGNEDTVGLERLLHRGAVLLLRPGRLRPRRPAQGRRRPAAGRAVGPEPAGRLEPGRPLQPRKMTDQYPALIGHFGRPIPGTDRTCRDPDLDLADQCSALFGKLPINARH